MSRDDADGLGELALIGVWGGLSAKERRRRRRATEAPLQSIRAGRAVTTAACGTEAGYRSHRRAGERAGPACKVAAAEAKKQRREDAA